MKAITDTRVREFMRAAIVITNLVTVLLILLLLILSYSHGRSYYRALGTQAPPPQFF